MSESRSVGDCLVGIQECINNMDDAALDGYARKLVLDRMRQKIAHFIADSKVKVEQRKYHTEYRLELYVFSPDELHQLIQREAIKMYRGYEKLKVPA